MRILDREQLLVEMACHRPEDEISIPRPWLWLVAVAMIGGSLLALVDLISRGAGS